MDWMASLIIIIYLIMNVEVSLVEHCVLMYSWLFPTFLDFHSWSNSLFVCFQHLLLFLQISSNWILMIRWFNSMTSLYALTVSNIYTHRQVFVCMHTFLLLQNFLGTFKVWCAFSILQGLWGIVRSWGQRCHNAITTIRLYQYKHVCTPM